jgi:ATP-dependent Clp protease protease subunit
MRKISTSDLLNFDHDSIANLSNMLRVAGEDVEINYNSFGGSTYSGQAFIDFLNNKENRIDANVSGIAASMGALIIPFFSNTKVAFQADIMIHSVDGGEDGTIEHTNNFIYQALASVIDEAKFTEITGKNLKEVMTAQGDKRIDVWFTGKDAVEMGMFKEGYDLLEKVASLKIDVENSKLNYKLPENIKEKYGLVNKKVNINEMEITDVTITKLEEGNPDVYNAILEKGKKAEQTRMSEIMEYAEYDKEKANSLAKSGEELSKNDVKHFMQKKFDAEKLAELEDESVDSINPAKPVKKAEEKKPDEKTAALEDLDKDLNPEFHKS